MVPMKEQCDEASKDSEGIYDSEDNVEDAQSVKQRSTPVMTIATTGDCSIHCCLLVDSDAEQKEGEQEVKGLGGWEGDVGQ